MHEFSPKPPLGELRLPQIPYIQALVRVSELPHSSVEDLEQGVERFAGLTDFAAEFQRKYGHKPAELPIDSVHVLDEETMKEALEIAEMVPPPGRIYAGFYDRITGVSYATESDPSHPAHEIDTWFTIAHEIGHKITPAVLDYSPHVIVEGLASRFARDYLGDVFLPDYLPQAGEVLNRSIHSRTTEELRRNSGIFFSDPKYRYPPSQISYACETRIIDAFEDILGRIDFYAFMNLALDDDPRPIDPFIMEHLGAKTLSSLGRVPKEVSARDLILEFRDVDWHERIRVARYIASGRIVV